jgi:hypothetical protein
VRIGLGPNNRDYITKGVADGIAIFLGEPQGQPATSWRLDVFALTPIGRFMVGSLFTVPAVVGAAVGGAPDRLIGHAYCPGARAWMIKAVGPNPTGGTGVTVGVNVSAELKAMPVKCCFGQATGVFYARGRIINRGGPLATFREDAGTPARLSTIYAYCPGTNAAENWLMFFDAIAVPPNGTQPYTGLAVDLDPGETGDLAFDPALFFTTGITWALSTTPDTLTLSLADTVRVITSQEW